MRFITSASFDSYVFNKYREENMYWYNNNTRTTGTGF